MLYDFNLLFVLEFSRRITIFFQFQTFRGYLMNDGPEVSATIFNIEDFSGFPANLFLYVFLTREIVVCL